MYRHFFCGDFCTVFAKGGHNQYTMDLHVTKNIQFTRLVKAALQQREFNFRKIHHAPILTFHVDVSDEKMNRHIFLMQKEGNEWKIIGQRLPRWIEEAGPQLTEIVESASKGF